MALLGSNVVTLADWAKRLDPNGKVPRIIEILSQTNEILMDMQWKEGNLPTGHRTTVRTGLPTAFWRLLNQGVQPSKSTTAQIDEACGILEAWSEVDVALAKLNGNVNEFRLSEAVAFIEAMNQEMAQTIFYGNSGLAPEEFTGLSIRYSQVSAANGQNIVLGGGAAGQTDCASIWLIVWGELTVHGIFPKGSEAGLQHNDLGEQTVETVPGQSGSVSGTRLRVYQDQFVWNCGIALKDWRFAVRIANIDLSNDNAAFTSLMTKAYHRIPNLNMGKAAFYANRSMVQRLDLYRQTQVNSGGGLSYDVVDGKKVNNFRGIPIRTTDALLDSETGIALT